MGTNIHLRFPIGITTEPVVCNITRLFDLDFNITKAEISSKSTGYMILELLGSKEKIQQATKYLQERGIVVSQVAQRIKRDEEKCVDCGVCTAICPTHALYMGVDNKLVFDTAKCTICTRCTKTCPVRAMLIDSEVLESRA